MKHFMQPRNPVLRENHDLLRSPNPSPVKQRSAGRKHQQKWSSKENDPPTRYDANAMLIDSLPSPSVAGKPSPLSKMRSPLPPRPPPLVPSKRKLSVDSIPDNCGVASTDSGVKVIVRMRPPNKYEEEGGLIIEKVSSDSLSILGHSFTYDSIADTEASQLDIFELVGAPVVENCIAGFNSSVFAYGQTGSGKTYTIWGPADALLEENVLSDQQGLTPRVFERLFSRIDEEQIKHVDKQLVYQCRCSFLEIYNEQITDLLNQGQRNLQIREDVKIGVYVENLTEECVSTMKDVRQLLIKGLSNRRIGATSINAESSRSHSVFTCVVESRCKSAANGLSFLKTSRINLVDLAGSERQKYTGAAGERLKEAGNINRSLSQLGNLINILAEISQTGKRRHIPYRDSKLTFLLQESLGGNAKLAMVCAISPSQSCKSETFSTLRFAQRAKAIKNKAVVNEEMQDDVNVMREVIRQLKDELQRMKANGKKIYPNGKTSWNARRSLNLLKFSLNHPLMLPQADEDSDVEMEIVQEAESAGPEKSNTGDGSNWCAVQSAMQHEGSKAGPSKEPQLEKGFEEQCFKETDVNMEDEILERTDDDEINTVYPQFAKNKDSSATQVQGHKKFTERNHVDNLVLSSVQATHIDSSDLIPSCLCDLTELSGRTSKEFPSQLSAKTVLEETPENFSNGTDNNMTSDLTIVPCDVSPILKSPTPSVSPRVRNNSRKSLRTSSMLTAFRTDSKDKELDSGTVHVSYTNPSKRSCLNRSKSNFPPTELLAASLQRGLEVFSSHKKSSAFRTSPFMFSLKPVDLRPLLSVEKVDVGVQTLLQDDELLKEDLVAFLCSKCKNKNSQQEELKGDTEDSNLQLVPVDGSADKTSKHMPKAVEKVLAGAIRREMALEDICAMKTSEIMQLKRLVQQYNHERECNAIIGQTREDRIVRLESLMDGILPTEEFIGEEFASLIQECKLLQEKYENHPEVLRSKIGLKNVQDELERYRNFFDMGERDVLLEEIQDLRNQFQFYVDSSPKLARKRSPLLQLTYSCEPCVVPSLCTIPESNEESIDQKLEQERICWTDAKSKWISLEEELRIELEESRALADKKKQELYMEKKCSEELKEALQMAMEGHARMLEQYAELEEKHMQLLSRHRKIHEGIDDVKKAAARAGVRGAESRFINALAAEISALKVERERERQYFRDENKGLQAQLRDTAEAVQAAGELLVRLKETEEAIVAAEMRAAVAEQETENVYKQINKLKKKDEKEMINLKQLNEKAFSSREGSQSVYGDFNTAKYDAGVTHDTMDHQWKEEFEQFYNTEEEFSKLAEHQASWFSGYDQCNI